MQHKVANLKRDFAYAPLAAVLNLGECEKKVWLTLFTFQGQNDYCFPSLVAIRKRMGMTEKDISLSWISRITSQLVKKGWLEKWRRGRRNQYRVIFPQDMLFVPDFGSLSGKPNAIQHKAKDKKQSEISLISKSKTTLTKKYRLEKAGRFGYSQLIKRPDEDDSPYINKYGQDWIDYGRSVGFTPSEYELFCKSECVNGFDEYAIRLGFTQEEIDEMEEDYNGRINSRQFQVA